MSLVYESNIPDTTGYDNGCSSFQLTQHLFLHYLWKTEHLKHELK